MAAQTYKIRTLKKLSTWKGSYGDFQDYAIQLDGVGEPVKLSLPMPILEDPEVGDQIYGRLYEEKGSSGRVYYRLKPEPRPESDIRTVDIHAQVGTKLAVQLWGSTEYESEGDRMKGYANIATEALHFARIIDDVRKELLK